MISPGTFAASQLQAIFDHPQDADLNGPLVGDSLDGTSDWRALGPGWVLFYVEGEDLGQDAFEGAYELAGAT